MNWDCKTNQIITKMITNFQMTTIITTIMMIIISIGIMIIIVTIIDNKIMMGIIAIHLNRMVGMGIAMVIEGMGVIRLAVVAGIMGESSQMRIRTGGDLY